MAEKQVVWNDQVEVQILEMTPVKFGQPKSGGGRVLWKGIDLAEAVRRCMKLPADDLRLVTIFGTQSFAGKEIEELAKRKDFPRA